MSALASRPRPATRSTRVTSPAPRELWREALQTDPDVLPSQTPEWIDCMRAFGGYEDASRLYELPEERLLVLPMVRTRFSQASLPAGWGIGGLVAPGGTHAEDARTVFADLTARRLRCGAIVGGVCPVARQGNPPFRGGELTSDPLFC